ncbi:unnamed protein product [Bursaphelenchus xylophilus]|uniref:(pine wood nematode) hypothetical protein n=1 Tax=Bursaphelenchus xylophilus TaxID=6326 RepID=A0A811KDC1_BURXY|nr:unnamed protein product [Bursaphelenchus xylophilus]CAG9092001.1 unnamed protein product [Bursaphelenchus xylophilus]
MFLKGNLQQYEASVKCLNGQTLDENINLMLTQQTEQLQRVTQLAQEIVDEWKAEDDKSDRVGRLVKCILNAHLFKDRAISRSNALHLFRLIEVMQVLVIMASLHVMALRHFGSSGMSGSRQLGSTTTRVNDTSGQRHVGSTTFRVNDTA